MSPPDEIAEVTTVVEAAPLFVRVTKEPAPPHDWLQPRRRIAPEAAPTGREQIEKRCLRCELFRITILGDVRNPRAYRVGQDGAQFYADREPECVPVLTDAGCKP